MRKTLRKVLAVLDGRPADMRGQSLVELAVTAPIFLIMLTGLVEVGWYANNFLIISDVVRSAGRYGSLRDPFEWIEGQEKNYEFLDCNAEIENQGYSAENVYNLLMTGQLITTPPSMGAGFFDGAEGTDLGYYDGVACAAIANMAPLVFDEERDDIVVSVFSYVVMGHGCTDGVTPCIRVSGRYPTNQNECASDSRDPFDVDEDGTEDDFEKLVISQELIVGSNPPAYTYTFDDSRFDPSTNEGYRGYVLRANQVVKGDNGCRGSDFSVDLIQDMLNKTLLHSDPEDDITNLETVNLQNYGMVLVEMNWHSDQLLGLPFFIWIPNPIEIRMWGMFPVPAAEPDLDCSESDCKVTIR